ncbi:hypothetical protein M0R45_034960 [Rubus argutus]|uniref:Gamma tubulin complex component C-terminal domain-containing protein n=1 Tax=Rubus argutus TaxID=59490 RepID=A0AAW1VRP8_RUBAR
MGRIYGYRTFEIQYTIKGKCPIDVRRWAVASDFEVVSQFLTQSLRPSPSSIHQTLLQFHFAPLALPLETIKWLPVGTNIPTLLSGHSLVVTTQPSDSAISLNNDKITTGLLIYDDMFLIILGAENFFDSNYQGRGCPANNYKHHWLVEQKLLHFVDAFHQYVMDRVYHNAWRELCEGMAAARSLDEVIEVHELYLLSMWPLEGNFTWNLILKFPFTQGWFEIGIPSVGTTISSPVALMTSSVNETFRFLPSRAVRTVRSSTQVSCRR